MPVDFKNPPETISLPEDLSELEKYVLIVNLISLRYDDQKFSKKYILPSSIYSFLKKCAFLFQEDYQSVKLEYFEYVSDNPDFLYTYNSFFKKLETKWLWVNREEARVNLDKDLLKKFELLFEVTVFSNTFPKKNLPWKLDFRHIHEINGFGRWNEKRIIKNQLIQKLTKELDGRLFRIRSDFDEKFNELTGKHLVFGGPSEFGFIETPIKKFVKFINGSIEYFDHTSCFGKHGAYYNELDSKIVFSRNNFHEKIGLITDLHKVFNNKKRILFTNYKRFLDFEPVDNIDKLFHGILFHEYGHKICDNLFNFNDKSLATKNLFGTELIDIHFRDSLRILSKENEFDQFYKELIADFISIELLKLKYDETLAFEIFDQTVLYASSFNKTFINDNYRHRRISYLKFRDFFPSFFELLKKFPIETGEDNLLKDFSFLKNKSIDKFHQELLRMMKYKFQVSFPDWEID